MLWSCCFWTMAIAHGATRLRYATHRGGPQTVLAFGDSLTAGYYNAGWSFNPYALELEAGLGVPVDNVGLSGWTSSDMLEEASLARVLSQARAAGAPYGLVVIMAGTNDFAGAPHTEKTALAIAASVWRLHATAHDAGARTVAIAVPGSRPQQHTPQFRQAVLRCNRELKERAEASKFATFVDFPVAYDDNSGLWEPDGLHMSQAGYTSLGHSLVEPVLATLRQFNLLTTEEDC